MKCVQWISAACVVCAVFAVLPRDHGTVVANAYGETGFVLASAEPAKNCSSVVLNAPEDRFAWDEFASLVHPSCVGKPVDGEHPEWLSWYNKCDAGLAAACEDPPRKHSTLPVDEFAAEIPRQLMSDFNKIGKGEQQNKFLRDFSHAPQLDSVLFNPVATDSIRRSDLGRASSLDLVVQQLDMQNVSGADRRLPAGSFAFGSEIVKLIWEIMPDNGKEALPLYDSSNPPVLADSLQLLKQEEWHTRYKIDPDRDKLCPEVLPPYDPDHAPVVPIKCFYAFRIRTDKSCPDLSQDIQLVWCRAAVKEKNFLVFLVGFHVMKLTPGNPDWIWSTYYWTRETNKTESGHGWNAPWNHFHQATTTAIRENAGDHAISYNPYLEGPQTNGLKANCLSCHSFAAYAGNVDKVDPGTTYGEEYPYPKANRLLDEHAYFRGAVQTGFVWSISTSQNKPGSGQDPTLFQNTLEKVLQEQFHNQ